MRLLNSWADLSYVVLLVASSYIVTTILSEFILHEGVVLARWLAVILVAAGVLLTVQSGQRRTLVCSGSPVANVQTN